MTGQDPPESAVSPRLSEHWGEHPIAARGLGLGGADGDLVGLAVQAPCTFGAVRVDPRWWDPTVSYTMSVIQSTTVPQDPTGTGPAHAECTHDASRQDKYAGVRVEVEYRLTVDRSPLVHLEVALKPAKPVSRLQSRPSWASTRQPELGRGVAQSSVNCVPLSMPST